MFNRSDLALAGEAGTGRLQVAASYLLKVEGHDGKVEAVYTSVELVDNSTSKTAVYIVHSSQQYQVQR